MTLKDGKGIGIEHLSPFIAVVAGGISACHDVRELHRHTGVRQLLT